ncbi:hypothetical protein DPMN_103933 [Dreissena polymorpha]|uniref:Uncharacterized protein n=1 Tax=Dreissena polymorpha TaxID=45954 RepID=A0A9D4HF06_DREPO|nr:hypothetical protein DPMN_103933 [Dreissena polymorpha]
MGGKHNFVSNSANVHVGMPAQHGNTATLAAFHYENGKPNYDISVDMPGEHANTGSLPVHRGTRGKPEHYQEPTAPASTNPGSEITAGSSRRRFEVCVLDRWKKRQKSARFSAAKCRQRPAVASFRSAPLS